MAWSFAAFTPHPPIIEPTVGQGREQEAPDTLKGMKALRTHITKMVKKNGVPEALLVLSPHHPFVSGTLFVNSAEQITGSLAPFGAPEASICVQTPGDHLTLLRQHLKSSGLSVSSGSLPDITRDHGTLVPLLQVQECFPGGKLPPVITAGMVGLSYLQAFKLGQCLAGLKGSKNWGLIASGDLSHKLAPNAPAGYSPCGKEFDEAVVKAFETGKPGPLLHLPQQTVQEAGECGLRSALAMLGLIDAPAKVLSYEGPFGVGYATAVWGSA